MPFFFDPTFLLLIPVLIFAMYAQGKVKSTFQRFSRVPSRRGYTGAQAAHALLQNSNALDVAIEEAPGQLTDHYDPRSKVLRLSSDVSRSSSLAALGVAAHEAGHAIQHAEQYNPLVLRNAIAPVASFGSNFAFVLFFIGLIFFRGSPAMKYMLDAAIVLYCGAVFFTVITLPVEYNASKRAVALLTTNGIITQEEAPDTKRVLDAAALTYVASVAMAVMQLIRLLLLREVLDD